jgi:hypothetical protein
MAMANPSQGTLTCIDSMVSCGDSRSRRPGSNGLHAGRRRLRPNAETMVKSIIVLGRELDSPSSMRHRQTLVSRSAGREKGKGMLTPNALTFAIAGVCA